MSYQELCTEADDAFILDADFLSPSIAQLGRSGSVSSSESLSIANVKEHVEELESPVINLFVRGRRFFTSAFRKVASSKRANAENLTEETSPSPPTQGKRNAARGILPTWDRGRNLSWRTGLQVAFCISILVFVINFTLLLAAAFTHGGYKDGTSTLAEGNPKKIATIVTSYHILINILSTGLLTSSNFCMQLLCAPTRKDIDDAHARGHWLDISLLSLRNLHFISRRKVILWFLLAASSIPLHLFYNSAVFNVSRAQDYAITFVNSSNATEMDALARTATSLTNEQWQSLYDTQYVAGAADLFLVVDMISYNIELNITDQTWQLAISETTDLSSPIEGIFWPFSNGFGGNSTVEVMIDLFTQGNFTVNPTAAQPGIVPVDIYPSPGLPNITWPSEIMIYAASTPSWKSGLTLSPNDWTADQVHIDYAYSVHVDNGTLVQIALGFMIVVVICNAVKVVVIYLTMRETFEDSILTQGDAIASFLERPDMSTLGMCILDKKSLLKTLREPDGKEETASWQSKKYRYGSHASRRSFSNSYMDIAGLLAVVVLILALAFAGPKVDGNDLNPSGSWDWSWGPASKQVLSFSIKAFNTKALLFNGWLANVPQVFLSIFYVAWNRVCTTMCFTREWNQYAVSRKGLRVTQPEGKSAQRTAYFLQLPYKWAVPLITTSGLLHWLLSQSFFLVRVDVYNRDGVLDLEGSKSGCGFSCLGLLIFSLTFIAMLTTIYVLQFRRMTTHLPLAQHCSLVIAAACHPPPDDEDSHLKAVQWGVVRSRFGGSIAHCTFTSEEVTEAVDGGMYA